MVELEPIKAEDESLERLAHQGGDLEGHGLVDVLHDMTRFDAERLRQLIEKHVHYTNSSLGAKILEQWDFYQPQFVKVMPVDYRRALEEMELAQSAEAGETWAEGH
jgi:glutamate synthase (NADPH/NADH) large chain